MQASLFYEPHREAEKPVKTRRGCLGGLYRAGGRLLQSLSGGRTVEVCKSKRQGRQPYYLRDGVTREFISSIYTDNGYREIEYEGERYRLVSRNSETVEFVYLRDVRRRGAA